MPTRRSLPVADPERIMQTGRKRRFAEHQEVADLLASADQQVRARLELLLFAVPDSRAQVKATAKGELEQLKHAHALELSQAVS